MTENTGIAIVIISVARQYAIETETEMERDATVDQTRCSIEAITIVRPSATTIDPFLGLALPRKNKYAAAGLDSDRTTEIETSGRKETTVTTETTEKRGITETLETTETETKEKKGVAREIDLVKMVGQKVEKTQLIYEIITIVDRNEAHARNRALNQLERLPSSCRARRLRGQISKCARFGWEICRNTSPDKSFTPTSSFVVRLKKSRF